MGKSTRPGVYKCKDCRNPFTVTVGFITERAKIPVTKWLRASQLVVASKKIICAKQLEQMLGITYVSALFSTYRFNEAMTTKLPGGELSAATRWWKPTRPILVARPATRRMARRRRRWPCSLWLLIGVE